MHLLSSVKLEINRLLSMRIVDYYDDESFQKVCYRGPYEIETHYLENYLEKKQ